MNVGFYGSFTVYPLCAFFCCRRCCWPWVFLLGFFASLFCYKTILQNNNFLYRSNPIFSQLPGDHNCGSNAILTTLYEVEWPIIDINIVKKTIQPPMPLLFNYFGLFLLAAPYWLAAAFLFLTFSFFFCFENFLRLTTLQRSTNYSIYIRLRSSFYFTGAMENVLICPMSHVMISKGDIKIHVEYRAYSIFTARNVLLAGHLFSHA